MEQLDPRWRKARCSGNGGADCVETGTIPGAVLIRDTKDREHGPMLRVNPEAWRVFTAGIKSQDLRPDAHPKPKTRRVGTHPPADGRRRWGGRAAQPRHLFPWSAGWAGSSAECG